MTDHVTNLPSLSQELIANLRTAEYSRGQNIITQGDSGDTFHVMLAGLANIFKSFEDEPGDKFLNQLGHGDVRQP